MVTKPASKTAPAKTATTTTTRRPRATKPTDVALAKFEADFGKSFGIDTMRRDNKIEPYEIIPTGSIELDFALGTGGWVLGSMSENWGPDGTGKTTLALIGCASAQRVDPRPVAFIDMERKLNRKWAQKLGVDLRRMYQIKPSTAEDVSDVVKKLIESKLVSFIVLDSIGAMISKEEKEKDAEERSVGTTPQIVTRMVKMSASILPDARCHLHMINQVRANLGYGADTTTGGGHARSHATIHRLKSRKALGKAIQLGSGNDAVQVGFQTAIRIEKNQANDPGRTAIVTFVNRPTEKYGMNYGVGDRPGEAFSVGKKTGIIERTGGKYVLPDGQMAKSEEECRALLKADPALVEMVREKIIEAISSGTLEDTSSGSGERDERDPYVGDDGVLEDDGADDVAAALAERMGPVQQPEETPVEATPEAATEAAEPDDTEGMDV